MLYYLTGSKYIEVLVLVENLKDIVPKAEN